MSAMPPSVLSLILSDTRSPESTRRLEPFSSDTFARLNRPVPGCYELINRIGCSGIPEPVELRALSGGHAARGTGTMCSGFTGPLLQPVARLFVFSGEQGRQSTTPCRYNQFRTELCSHVYSKQSMAQSVLLEIRPAKDRTDSLSNRAGS